MGSYGDGDDYDSLAPLLAVSSDCSIHHTHTLVFEDEDSRRLGHVIVDAQDRRERGRRQPSAREVHTTCVASTYLQTFTCVCAEMLWYGELVRVRSRAIAVVVSFFSRALFKQQSVNWGFIMRVVDPILPVRFCDPKIHLILEFGHAIIFIRWPY